jgi:haloacetate dehalogenase
MDDVPTRIVGRELDAAKAKGYWFFLVHLVPDLPEALIAGREDIWLRYYFSDWCVDPLTIQGEAFDTYVKAYRAPGAIRGAMEDYRANAADVAQGYVDASVKIACPVMSIWGRDFKLVGEMFDMPRVWAEMASNLVTHAIPECGHLSHEEKPEENQSPSDQLPRRLERLIATILRDVEASLSNNFGKFHLPISFLRAGR